LDSGDHPHEAHCLELDCSKAKSRLRWPRASILKMHWVELPNGKIINRGANMSSVLRKHLTADASRAIHLVLPRGMSDEAESGNATRGFGYGALMDESGFVKNILNGAEEDCWNDL